MTSGPCRGLTLLEVLVAILLIGVLAVLGGIGFGSGLRRHQTQACADRIAASLYQIRTQAQAEGERGTLLLAPGAIAADLDGDGNKEYFIGFLDLDRNGNLDTGGATPDRVILHGTPGDSLCSPVVRINAGTTTRKIQFSALGSLLGASGDNLYLTAGDKAARVEVVSLTGLTRVYVNMDACGGGVCTTAQEWMETGS